MLTVQHLQYNKRPESSLPETEFRVTLSFTFPQGGQKF